MAARGARATDGDAGGRRGKRLALSPLLRAAIVQGLAEEGYVEGKNLVIDWSGPSFDLLAEAMREAVRRNVNVIFAPTPEAVVAARNATTSIPIVAVDLESDPIANGYVKSLARPGGNLTGMFLDLPELSGKQVGLLKEIVPRLSRIAIFGIPGLNALQRLRRWCGRLRSKLKLWKCE
jgi:putative ABC transport system substrate-binding protein